MHNVYITEIHNPCNKYCYQEPMTFIFAYEANPNIICTMIVFGGSAQAAWPIYSSIRLNGGPCSFLYLQSSAFPMLRLGRVGSQASRPDSTMAGLSPYNMPLYVHMWPEATISPLHSLNPVMLSSTRKTNGIRIFSSEWPLFYLNIGGKRKTWWYNTFRTCKSLSKYKDRLAMYGISTINIRRSWNCFIFIMGISILVIHIYIETAPNAS